MLPKKIALFFFILSLVGCSSTNAPAPNYTLTITGTLKFVSPTTLPPDVKVVCVWPNGNESDFNDTLPPAFGTGTFDTVAKTFSVSFSGVPPSVSVSNGTNRLTLGYAHILLVGDDASGYPRRKFGPYNARILGAVNNTAVVYHTYNATLHSSYFQWLNASQGYVVGTRVAAASMDGVDSLVQSSSAGLVLTIDTDTTGIHFPQVIPSGGTMFF
jgi:hypothetical protein